MSMWEEIKLPERKKVKTHFNLWQNNRTGEFALLLTLLQNFEDT